MIKQTTKHGLLFICGGLLYVALELLWRGFSHWTMFMVGGFCFVAIGLLNELFPWEMPLWQQGIIGAALITAMELIIGYIVNIRLGWMIWDYSDMPLNVAGQICLPFSLLWIFVSVAAVILDDYLRFWMFGEEKPHYRY